MNNIGTGARPKTVNAFGPALQAELDRLGWSQTRLAQVAATDHSHVSRAISGTRAPSREMVLRWANAMRLDARRRDLLLVSAQYIPDNPYVRDAIVAMLELRGEMS